MKLGQRILDFQSARNLGQRALADNVGISRDDFSAGDILSAGQANEGKGHETDPGVRAAFDAVAAATFPTSRHTAAITLRLEAQRHTVAIASWRLLGYAMPTLDGLSYIVLRRARKLPRPGAAGPASPRLLSRRN